MSVHSEFSVRSSSGQYNVQIGAGLFDRAVDDADVVIVDAALADRVSAGDRPVLTLTADEDTKTLAGCEQVILAMRSAGVRRGDRVLAVGGGVVQDVATFVTDVYMRGLPWSYAPTTLMAMADSCIGGKSSINVGGVKNLVGGIYPPGHVVVDPAFLDTLGATAQAAGLAEAAKIAFCRGADTFEGYLQRFARFEDDPAELIDHVLRAKRWFVEVDEHDHKERRLLNFGHTFGHALEVAVDHAIPHGIAVAIGVLCASAHPAAGTGPLTDALVAHCRSLIAQDVAVPSALEKFDPVAFERAFRSDKKHDSTTFRLILPSSSGGVEEVRTGNAPEDWAHIVEVTDRTLDSLRGTRG